MKKIFTALFLISLIPAVTAQTSFNSSGWQLWNSRDAVPSRGEQKIVPEKASIFYIHTGSLKSRLFSLGSSPEEAEILELPAPDGSLKEFLIREQSCMEPALAAKYPEIKTFTGYQKGNPLATVRLDYTVFGFHAMVLDGNQTYFIDPYSTENDGFYICYKKSDYTKPLEMAMSCHVSDEFSPLEGAIEWQSSGKKGAQYKTHGSMMRTFRLALACTGEYAKAVAGNNPSKAAVLSQMVTTINRVNSVYNRELSVHLNLIAHNDTLIFLDPATDPYNNTASSAEFNNNQKTLDTLIGNANFDIGHLFSTSGGGVATLASVCKPTKARGLTGLPNPVGDPFDIDYVCHEIGHQFGANHTFNANSGSCNGNGARSSAYEPGGGSTIMAYAGICTGNNLQAHSDAYFHARSLMEINRFLTSPVGATCADSFATGNNPPVIPSFTQSYVIPFGTPFELTAPAAIDQDNDTLTYCWEQWNLGDFRKNWNDTYSEGPLFRSFMPDTSRTRVFPKIEKLVAGITAYLGEKLPDSARELTFRLTVRDVYNGSGSFNFPDDSIKINVVKNSPVPFSVTAPAGGQSWVGGTQNTITWNVANTDLLPVSCANVDIYLSEDGGFTYPHLIVANTPNDGSETVTVPNITSTNQARIKVKASNNVFFNISPADFSIVHNTSGVNSLTWQQQIEVFPVPATDVLSIRTQNNMRLEIHITNITGQEIFNGKMLKQLNIPVKQWAKGVYYLHLTDPVSREKLVRPLMIR